MLKLILGYFKLNRYQIIKFIIIGIITFIINFLTFHYFYKRCSFNYKIATSFSFVITVISHFLLHRVFTFKVREEKQQLTHHLSKYILMLCLNYLITITVMWLTVEVVHGSAYLGIIASTLATASSSFLTMKYFVFSKTKLIWPILKKNKCAE